MRFALVTFLMLATTSFATEPVAVVELFTSEGCSSCPPADALLNELGRQPHVFALAFHVDYWNYLGWADPFSKSQFTDRQRAYGRELYTPQMIVNGTEAFVGSDRVKAKRSIETALKLPASAEVKLQRRDNVTEYEVAGAPQDAVVHFAVIESGIAQKVDRGENAGRILHHDGVVREFVTRPVGKGQLRLSGPVVAYVQVRNNGAILAAASVAGN